MRAGIRAEASTAMTGGEAIPSGLRSLPSRLLGRCSTHADRIVSVRLAEADARKWHYSALVSLVELGPASQADLSRRTGIFRSDMVAVINELVYSGYVERAPDPLDRRRNVITATRRGRSHLQRLHAIVARAQEELLTPLNTTEREQLTILLLRLDRYHETASNRATT